MIRTALTSKQRLFVESFLETWNATTAAKRAGYAHPNKQGWQTLNRPLVAEAIAERIKEAAMGADEILARLTQQARASVGEFLSVTIDEDGKQHFDIDWSKVIEKGYLVKKAGMTSYGPQIELYDAQAALVHLGRHLGLFTDNIDVTSKGQKVKAYIGVSPDDWDEDEPPEGG